MTLQEETIGQLSAKAKAAEDRAIMGILNKEGVLVEVIELEEGEITTTPDWLEADNRAKAKIKKLNREEERICKLRLNQWKRKALKHCRSGIDEADLFLRIHQDYYSKKIEQTREDLYTAIKILQ